MGPEILHFRQVPGDSNADGNTVHILRAKGPSTRHCDHPAPLFEIVLTFKQSFLMACNWSLEPQDRTEATEGVIPEFFPHPPGLTCTEGLHGPSTLLGSPHSLVWAASPVASVPGVGPVLCWHAVSIYHFEK